MRMKANPKIFKYTEAEYFEANEENIGHCLACGATAHGVEPDARGYECETCGIPRVYGLEELLMLGHVEFVDPSESCDGSEEER